MSIVHTDISNKSKKQRIKINNISDLQREIINENYKNTDLYFKDDIKKYLENGITYTAKNLDDFFDYMNKIKIFEDSHKRLCNKIKSIKKLEISRIEYEKEVSIQEDVDDIELIVESIRKDISCKADEYEETKIYDIEKEIDKEYIYTKDIELLKKMILFDNSQIKQEYNSHNKIKKISLNLKKEISMDYIPVKIGSIEYHNHIDNNIPRLKRLIKNLDKYVEEDCQTTSSYKINQSMALQDSINIAVAEYNGRVFKAISGSCEIFDYCSACDSEKTVFESCKVNRHGKLGIGYDREKDSEKKILEKIHSDIIDKKLSDKGELVLYSKWEPCPSCYYVIDQFCRIHPKIKVKVKYMNRYGEQHKAV